MSQHKHPAVLFAFGYSLVVKFTKKYCETVSNLIQFLNIFYLALSTNVLKLPQLQIKILFGRR